MKTTERTIINLAGLLLAVLVLAPGRLLADGLNLVVTPAGEIVSGGPAATEVKQALAERIQKQSGGTVSLVTVQPLKTRLADVDMNGKLYCEFGFEAEVAFAVPAQWAIRFDGRPLTFALMSSNQQAALVAPIPEDLITVTNAGEHYTVFGSVWFTPEANNWVEAGFAASARPRLTAELAAERCQVNLRLISAAFARYELAHDGKNPFNLSTNVGGTLELCGRDAAGGDTNSAVHFQALAEFLRDPDVLVCPGDSAHVAAKDFASLTNTNVSYLLHSGVAYDSTAQQHQILLTCPVHGWVVYTDGDIQKQ